MKPGKSWKTTLSGLVVAMLTLLLAVPSLMTAVSEWSKHQPVEWRPVILAVTLAIIAAGLTAAKDKEVHGGTIDSGERPDPVQTELATKQVLLTKEVSQIQKEKPTP